MIKTSFKKVQILVVFVFFFFQLAYAQERIITGIVKDEKGITLPGATVQVKNSSTSVMTDVNGRFSISLPANAKAFLVSFVGLTDQEVNIGNSNELVITLKSAISSLEDVIVVGYGTVKRKDATGAVTRISRDALVKDAPTNVLQALQGKIAGVNVTQNDGAPGAALSIRIRGSNSFLGGTEPLYVIDGVPFNNGSTNTTPSSIGGDEKQTLNALSFINPNDIETIDILKDASATAIYGSRGANGVVLITTRKGRTGKDKVELNLTVGMAQVSKTINVLDAQNYASYQNLAYTNANKYSGTNYTPDQFPYPGMIVTGPNGPYYKNGPADFTGKDKNWQDEIFRNALYHNYSVNVSGGNDAGNHSLSFNYLKQNGTIVNSDYNRFGLNLNLNRNIGKRFKMGTSTSLNHSVTNGVKTGTDKSDDANAGVIRAAISYPGTIDSLEAYGTVQGTQAYFITNPSIYAKDVLNKVTGESIFSSNYLEAMIIKGLTFRQNIGFNYATNRRDQYYPRTVFEGFRVKGDGLKSDDIWNSIISESILSYNKKINKHSFNVFGATTYERTNGQWKKQEATDFTSDILKNENLGSAKTQLTPQGDKYQSTLISFLGRLNYEYDNKYLLTASLRRDGSSKFGKNSKWANFPSVAFAWKVINEKFMESLSKTISDLKFRLSYGQTGNQGIGSYASWSKLKVYKYPLNGVLQTGYADDYYAGPANPDLKWETTSSYNAGIDIGFFNNRLNLHIDGYTKDTKDLLQYVTTPPSSGFPKKLVNAGAVKNKGIELALDAVAVQRKDFKWASSFNISFNRNEVTSLGADVEQQYAGNISTGDAPFIQKVGHPIGAVYGWVEDGYYDNEAEIRNDPQHSNVNAAAIKNLLGEVKYKNLDGDPTSIGDNDRTFIGNVNPDYTFGFTNNFSYKNFDLSIFINGVQGNDIINMNSRYIGNLGQNQNITQAMYDGAWREGNNNIDATGPKILHGFSRNLKFTRRFIEDGSFVRIKNITLGYNVKTKIAGIQGLRISAGVNNLYTFTNYTGYDPEINSYGDNPSLFGVDLGGYPNSRTVNLSVRCNF